MNWQLKEGILSVGAQDWDRRLFDELIPLPDGTSYNAYIISGQKTALIDTVDPEKTKELLHNLKEAGVKTIDYIIANHAEQDHSGSIPDILREYPHAKVVTNIKCKEFLKDLLHLSDESIQLVEDGEILDLGGKTLKFILCPWVHWPETMLTLAVEDKILFTCDLFGSHLASTDHYAKNDEKTMTSAKRYYAEIMMPFAAIIKNNLTKISELDFEMIAPSHGPVWKDPKLIMDSYELWISDTVENEVMILYVSMHGSCLEIANHLTDNIAQRGIAVNQFNLTKTDVGDLAMELVQAASIIIISPTLLGGSHPSAAYAAVLINALRPKTKNIAFVTSYSWGGRAIEQLEALTANLAAKKIESIRIKGKPTEEDLKLLDELSQMIYEAHKELNLIGE